MKNNYVIFLMIMLFCFGFFNTVYIFQTSAQNTYSLTLIDASFEVYKSEQITSTRILTYYNISILLLNSGPMDSDNITVEILGSDELPLYQEGVIAAETTKEFVWSGEEFFLVSELQGDDYVNIAYYPTNLRTSRTSANSGSEVLYLYEKGDDRAVAGFQVILVFGVIIFFYLTKRFKK